jgi:predicted dehydrogenase
VSQPAPSAVDAAETVSSPRTIPVGIIMNGVTGRMGSNQHLARSIAQIREEGGISLADGRRILPEPVLVGRNADRLQSLARQHGVERWTTDLDEVLGDPGFSVYFDAQVTSRRVDAVRRAIEAGKHVYCEKPTAEGLGDALELARLARDAGVKNGVVMDKLFLPGMVKLAALVRSGFLGDVLSVKGDFGYWVFDGTWGTPQRPSWNYRREDGGSMIADMFPHWRYVLDHVIAPVQSMVCHGATQISHRLDEQGRSYQATADDAAYAIFELAGGVTATMSSSWNTRVNRDELFELQVDGTRGSAVAGLRRCRIQPLEGTPRSVWNPDIPDPVDHRSGWQEQPDLETYDNGFKRQWELFLRHIVADEPFAWDLLQGARGVQLADLATSSWEKRAWVDVPELSL